MSGLLELEASRLATLRRESLARRKGTPRAIWGERVSQYSFGRLLKRHRRKLRSRYARRRAAHREVLAATVAHVAGWFARRRAA